MSYVLLELLPLGIAIAVSPFPIIPALLLLFTPRATANSLGFIGGWVSGIAGTTVVFGVLTAFIELWDEPPTWTSWARILIGLALVAFGIRQWLARKSVADTPSWMTAIDETTPGNAYRLGLILSAANPKILLLTAAAGVTLGAEHLGLNQTIVGLLFFTALASCTVASPLVARILGGPNVLTPLERAKVWLETNNATIMAIVILAIGLILTIKGIRGL